MKRLFFAVFAFLVAAGGAVAQDRRYEGYPNIERASGDHFYVWGNSDGRFNVRVTSDSRRTIMEGVIVVRGGRVTDVRRVRREAGDILRLSEDGTTIHFRFRVSRGIDGFNFRTSADVVGARFEADGEPVEPGQIILGGDESNPRANPFAIAARRSGVAALRDLDFNPARATIDVDVVIPSRELDPRSR